MLRRLTFTCSALILLAACAGAQDRGPPPKGPPMNEIASAVGLKDAQRAAVQAALEQHHAAMMALHDSMRSKHDALDQQLHTSLAKVLTPDQLTRFDSWQKTHRPPPPPDGPGGQGDRRGPPRGQGGDGQESQQMHGPAGQYAQGGPGGGGEGRRPPPPGGQGTGGSNDRPPPPPGGDWNNDATQNPPPPPK
ncbi:MAG TPA: periplasmic heavy metal sensor [Xanthomonadaceae bacterium]|jgi:hypothetical protein|nr:periplasmic heavy metal sensor [Xanthomonadaceae bacterium]